MAKAGLDQCHCGSKQYAPQRLDGHGIFLTYACDTCWPAKKAGYRVDIDEKYEADEPIDGDEVDEDRLGFGLDREPYHGPF